MFKEIFIKILGFPESEFYLDEYIRFVKDKSKTINENNYSEIHHVLPQCEFEDYSKEDWNLKKLEYNDHVTAHFLLFMAYPISSFKFFRKNIKFYEYKK